MSDPLFDPARALQKRPAVTWKGGTDLDRLWVVNDTIPTDGWKAGIGLASKSALLAISPTAPTTALADGTYDFGITGPWGAVLHVVVGSGTVSDDTMVLASGTTQRQLLDALFARLLLTHAMNPALSGSGALGVFNSAGTEVVVRTNPATATILVAGTVSPEMDGHLLPAGTFGGKPCWNTNGTVWGDPYPDGVSIFHDAGKWYLAVCSSGTLLGSWRSSADALTPLAVASWVAEDGETGTVSLAASTLPPVYGPDEFTFGAATVGMLDPSMPEKYRKDAKHPVFQYMVLAGVELRGRDDHHWNLTLFYRADLQALARETGQDVGDFHVWNGFQITEPYDTGTYRTVNWSFEILNPHEYQRPPNGTLFPWIPGATLVNETLSEQGGAYVVGRTYLSLPGPVLESVAFDDFTKGIPERFLRNRTRRTTRQDDGGSASVPTDGLAGQLERQSTARTVKAKVTEDASAEPVVSSKLTPLGGRVTVRQEWVDAGPSASAAPGVETEYEASNPAKAVKVTVETEGGKRTSETILATPTGIPPEEWCATLRRVVSIREVVKGAGSLAGAGPGSQIDPAGPSMDRQAVVDNHFTLAPPTTSRRFDPNIGAYTEIIRHVDQSPIPSSAGEDDVSAMGRGWYFHVREVPPEGVEYVYESLEGYFWPDVLASFQIYTIPLKGVSYNDYRTHCEYREGRNAKTKARILRRWSRVPPVVVEPQSMLTTGLVLSWPRLSVGIRQCLHGAHRFYVNIGSDDPTFQAQQLTYDWPATNFTDWPAEILADVDVRPYKGGYLSTQVWIRKPQ